VQLLPSLFCNELHNSTKICTWRGKHLALPLVLAVNLPCHGSALLKSGGQLSTSVKGKTAVKFEQGAVFSSW